MRRLVLIVLLVLLPLAGLFLYVRSQGSSSSGRPGMGDGAFARPPMTVELMPASRAEVTDRLVVVGNLVGAATVQVVPKVGGRLETIGVRIGDPVVRGQRLATVEDREIREQVKQAEAAFEVAAATVRQREADLKFAETTLERSRSLYGRDLLPRQSLDDAEARHQAAQAQLDLARAQFTQAQARLEELRIALTNTVIASPVDGFVARRFVDPGAFVSNNVPVVSVVDIGHVRLVANVVERDLRRVAADAAATVEVDAYPGETFTGRVARVAPVLDPATRTAEMEIEVPNPGFRLKPGMYARVHLTVDRRPDVLVVPRNAVVDLDGRRGVFVAEEETARFRPISTGLQDEHRVEVTAGVAEGEPVVTTGAAALRDGDRIVTAGQPPGSEWRQAPAAGRGGPPGRRPAG